MLGRVPFRFKIVRNLVVCDKLKNFKMVENSYGAIIFNRGGFFFEQGQQLLAFTNWKMYSEMG
jgi:hypothetical protein